MRSANAVHTYLGADVGKNERGRVQQAMAENPEYPPPDINSRPNQRHALRRVLNVTGGLLLLLFLAVAVAMLAYLLHPVPVPTVVQRIQDETERPATAPATATTEGTAGPTDVPRTSSRESIIPEDPDQPAGIVAKRAAYNAEYAELISDLDAYDRQKRAMSFPDSYSRLGSLRERYRDIWGRFAQEWKDSGGAPLAPSYHAVWEQVVPLQDRIDNELLESYVRHGQWESAAVMRQCVDWDEGVYYWRQKGGLTSLWHIGAGGLGRYLQEKQMPRALWRWLPYPDREPMAISGPLNSGEDRLGPLKP